ncbi:MAG: ABC transporter permease [Desulfurococcaceae archaeon]
MLRSKLLQKAYAVFKAYLLSEFLRSRGFIYGLVSLALWLSIFVLPMLLFIGETADPSWVSAGMFIGIMMFLFYSTASWEWAAELRWMISDGRIEYYVASGSGFLPHFLGVIPVSLIWLSLALFFNYVVLSAIITSPRLHVLNLPLFAYGLTLLIVCLMGYSLILGGTMISSGVSGFVVELISFVLPVATGGFLPLRMMPRQLQIFALCTPFSYPAEMIRYSILGIEPVLGLEKTVVIGTLYVFVFIAISSIYFKYQLNKALREGFKSISIW